MVTIVLVSPRNPNNIGAAARAMANFGLSDLRLVKVYAPTYKEAVSAVGAEEILKKAKVYDSLPEALADCHFSLATTSLKNRKIDKRVYSLPELKLPTGKTAIIFGPEKTGLCAADINFCNAVLNIPTAAKQPSINLAQAVTLVCYELSKTNNFKKLKTSAKTVLPKSADIELVSAEITLALKKAGFTQPAEIRNILQNSSLTRKQLFLVKKFINLLK